MGAAVLTDKGVFTGANRENACTNLGTCAERVALANARMHEAGRVIGIAISCPDAAGQQGGTVDVRLVMPCGACRQWLAELAPEAWIVTRGVDRVFALAELLPEPFTLTL